jgi:uncharacterized Zn finger protein (UPF0148 family)
MKRYCIDCGAPTEYSLKKPIFCSNCGGLFEKNNENPEPIIEKVQLQKKTIARQLPKPSIELDDNYDENDNDGTDEADVTEIPNISNIQVETDNIKKDRGVKLRDLMGTESSSIKREKNKTRGKKTSKKQILEDFAKEAGSLRKNRK